MSTQLDSTWLPPETRTGGDGTIDEGPFDYGSGEYGYLKRHTEKNPYIEGEHERATPLIYQITHYSQNIRFIIDQYDRWGEQKTKDLQIISDGKSHITIDDLLWYMRYEQKGIVPGLFGEERKNTESLLRMKSDFYPNVPVGVISHGIMHRIQESIKGLREISSK